MVAQIGAADALHYPALSLSGNFYISSTSFTDLSNWSNRAFSFGPTLSLPLFTGGKIDSQVLAAKASAEFAFNSWRGRLVQAVAEVDVAIATLALARDSDAQYKKPSRVRTTRIASHDCSMTRAPRSSKISSRSRTKC